MMRAATFQNLFGNYWSLDQVTEALQLGQVFECCFRVNRYNRHEAYVSLEGVPEDVLIYGDSSQNRAVEGDVVAVLLDSEQNWPNLKFNKTSESFESSSVEMYLQNGMGALTGGTAVELTTGVCRTQKLTQLEKARQEVAALLKALPGRRPSGKVVYILQKSPSRKSVIGYLKRKRESCGRFEDFLVFSPLDSRFPKMMVFANTVSKELFVRLQQGDKTVENELMAVSMGDWEADIAIPCAVLTECLGQAGEIEAETTAILFEHAVQNVEFSCDVLSCLPQSPWNIPVEEVAKRKDLRDLRIFSIDPQTARDLDDALSVEDVGNGSMRIGVHIADVTYFVPPDSVLDKEALARSTTVYLIQRAIPMLPHALSEDLCSLNPGVDRLAFSIMWEINSSGNVTDQWIGRSIIRSCCKLSYEQAQEMLDGESNVQPSIQSADFNWKDLAKDIRILYKIAMDRRADRIKAGALHLNALKISFLLDGDGNPYDSKFNDNMQSSMVVEEFMLLANMTVAKVISKAFPEFSLLRQHPQPNMRKLKEFIEFCAKNGFPLAAGSLQSSLETLKENLKNDPELLSIVTHYAMKSMQLAKYFSTGQLKDRECEWGHFALATPLYTHFTSPIRRYPDIIVHRILAAALEAEELLHKSKFKENGVLCDGRCISGTKNEVTCICDDEAEMMKSVAFKHRVLSSYQLDLVASHCNARKLASKNVRDSIDKLYLWSMLRKNEGVVSNARVVALGPKFMTVYVCKIAMERRICYDDVEGLKVCWLENIGTLVLDTCAVKQRKKGRSRGLLNVAEVVNPADVNDDGNDENRIEALALPLTLMLMSPVTVILDAIGGYGNALDIAARFYVSSFIT